MIFLYATIFINFCLLSQEDTIIPFLDLRNSDLHLNLEIDVLKEPLERSKILLPAEIEEIQNKAKNFKVQPVTDEDIVVFETSVGSMKLKLYNELAPNHCKNFKKLSNSGFYDETLIFRVVPNFMIQGGDLLTRDANEENDGTGNPGWTIDAEINNIKHKRGILSMAHGSDINSAGSQFFICTSDAKHLDGKYTAFGEIIDNKNLLDVIQNVPSQSKQMLTMAKDSIPKNSDADWILIIFNDNELYFKLPTNQTEDSYREFVLNRIENIYRPSIPITIKKIRVINKNDLPESDNKSKTDFSLWKNLDKLKENKND